MNTKPTSPLVAVAPATACSALVRRCDICGIVNAADLDATQEHLAEMQRKDHTVWHVDEATAIKLWDEEGGKCNHAKLISPSEPCSSCWPTKYCPEMRTMPKDAILAAIYALEVGLENTQELLIHYDTELGRTTRSNRCTAERLESEIRAMKTAIGDLSYHDGAIPADNEMTDKRTNP